MSTESSSTGIEKNLNGVIKIDASQIHSHLDSMVRSSVEDTLNQLLDEEADRLCNAGRYEHSDDRTDTRAGHYTRNLHVKAGMVKLKVPKLRKTTFETAIIERYRRREASVEEALIEMYLAGVSVRNIAVLVAVGVDSAGFREILGICEGLKEDQESWRSFLRHLKARGLKGVELVISDKCLGLVETLGEFFADAHWQRCMVHFYRNVFSAVPNAKVKEVAAMLKAIHAQEDRDAALAKAALVVERLESMRLSKAAATVRDGIDETLSYYYFPREHWLRIRTNNMLERIMREIRRRTRVVGNFPDGQSALMLSAARLRHIAGTKWSTVRYLNMKHLEEQKKREELGAMQTTG